MLFDTTLTSAVKLHHRKKTQMTKSAKKITKKPVAKKAANGHGSKTAKAVALMRHTRARRRDFKGFRLAGRSPAQLVRGGKVKIDDSVRPFDIAQCRSNKMLLLMGDEKPATEREILTRLQAAVVELIRIDEEAAGAMDHIVAIDSLQKAIRELAADVEEETPPLIGWRFFC